MTTQETITNAHKDFQSGMQTYAFFKTHDSGVGQDLVQDTFVKTWKYLVKGGQIEVMKAFLYHVLNNLIVDQYRKRKTTSLDMLLEKGYDPSAGGNEKLFNFLDGKSAVQLIDKLPIAYQKVMRMRYLQDFSLKEMSKATGKSTNTVAVQAYRGLEKLKVLYHNQPALA